MIGFILTLIIALVLAYFSRNNTAVINLGLGDYGNISLPLPYLTVGTYFLGIIFAWILEVPNSLANAFRIMGLGRTIKSGNNSIKDLQNKIIKLESENTRLREENRSIIISKKTDNYIKPNIFRNLFNRPVER